MNHDKRSSEMFGHYCTLIMCYQISRRPEWGENGKPGCVAMYMEEFCMMGLQNGTVVCVN